ncbi:hypothetical protein IFM89_031266 [Coptis chinensis]|uniref:Phytochrome kinase substrate 1 n=1 Tax=Coptis chinensis TaxID=261450 RepID=A0A835MGC7_9MAGN|nr:hypothetical protein IFM89_031266 [Coptis chinensis]
MATNRLASACITSTNPSHTLCNAKQSTDFHDASFSSYISNAKDSILRIARPQEYLSTTINDHQAYQLHSEWKTAKDGEINIFGAEKYFNGGMDEANRKTTESGERKHQPKEDGKVDLQNMRMKFKPGFQSVNSQSSQNSRSALLQGRKKGQSPSWRNRGITRHFLSTFSWKCSCSNKKSVDIDELVGDNKKRMNGRKNVDYGETLEKKFMEASVQMKSYAVTTNGTIQSEMEGSTLCLRDDIPELGLQNNENFVFTVSNSKTANLILERQCGDLEKGDARKSLEVFGSPIVDKVSKTMSLDRRLPMCEWEAKDIPATSASSLMQDDESDTSSDLFEINNISEDVHPFFRRQDSDFMSACATNTFYEPSEASVDWSVVTASAVNFPTTPNYERTPEAESAPPTKTTGETAAAKTSGKVQRSHPNAFLGCRSQKAVKVAGEAYSVIRPTS